jgi:hypothetical protein
MAGATFAARDLKPAPAASYEPTMAGDLRTAGDAIGKDADLSNRSAVALYDIMVGSGGPAAALDVFEEARAVPVVRQALLLSDYTVLLDAAKFFESSKDVSGLPELINLLERKNFVMVGTEAGGYGRFQHTLIHAIGAVTGMDAAAAAILPEQPMQQLQPQAVHPFIEKARRWAEEHGVKLYPPAMPEAWPTEGPPSIEEQLEWYSWDLHGKNPETREETRKHLQAIKQRIEDMLAA